MFRIPLNKINEAREVDFNALPKASQTHVIEYGLKQLLNDAMANGQDNAERRALADKRLDNLMAGVIRASRESDPVAREARKLAEAKAKADGLKPKSDEFKAAVNVYRAHPKIIALAERQVELASGVADIEID